MTKKRIQTRIQMYEKNSHTGMVDSQLQRPGSMGVQFVAQLHLSRDKKVNYHPSICQPTNPFFERWVEIELLTLWLLDNHTHHWATVAPNTNVQMYEKTMHKMYDKNTHTTVLKKHAYKRMKKILI